MSTPWHRGWQGSSDHTASHRPACQHHATITTSRLGYVVPPHLLCNLSHGTSYSSRPQGLLTLRLALLQTQWQNHKAYVI